MYEKRKADVLIIGSGLAALTAADRLSAERNVTILTKSLYDSNSLRAQGGIAAVYSEDDNWKLHVQDTMLAGCYHNNEESVEFLVKNGSILIKQLIEAGFEFDKDRAGNIALGQEGAHSKRRILHAGGDATGKALTSYMLNKVKESVTIINQEVAIDLIVENGVCYGVVTLDPIGNAYVTYASDIILATGGCGGLYQFTSNNPHIIGDGIAMAYRAGAELIDLEFVQFHPTLLYVDGEGKGLISEAVRGEGAYLINQDNERLMEAVHPLQDLAPRDIVAREIHRALLSGEKIYLDISMIENFEKRFPTITALCRKHGISLQEKRIPVVPGAHFLMGGVKTNLKGETNIKRLYAVGELASAGIHGANRLASNSLLETIVFGTEVANNILNKSSQSIELDIAPPKKEYKRYLLPTEDEIKNVMSTYVGIVRSQETLTKAKRFIESYLPPDRLGDPLMFQAEPQQIKALNMLTTAWLITTSALERTESRGGHYRTDFPHENNNYWKQKGIIRNSRKEKALMRKMEGVHAQ